MDSMARRWIRWLAKGRSKTWASPSILLLSILIRWLVGLGGYSGEGTPPLYGDFEAQRHWMELTLHLPVSQWYKYDVLYWGLDYPPLTAYVSWLCGYIGETFDPRWFALTDSRGIESDGSKAYMRSTVIAWDIIIYSPSIWCFSRCWLKARSQRSQTIAMLTLLLQPALLLVDHGHFQYNSIMLGLCIISFNLFHEGHDILGAVVFTLALTFKQMALYYSPAIFAYLFGKCIYLGGKSGLSLFLALGITSLTTLCLLFSPFLRSPFPVLFLESIHRIFPISRGLFEDKVANFWCASNILMKWRERSWIKGRLPLFATILTTLGFLPSMLHMLYLSWMLRPRLASNEGCTGSPGSTNSIRNLFRMRRPAAPTIILLPYVLGNCAFSFFLFSFQVHEKSILLPLLPFTLMMGGREDLGPSAVGVWEWGVLLNNVAVFSLWPLLRRDGQTLQYVVLTLFWNYLIGHNPWTMPSSWLKVITQARVVLVTTSGSYGGLICLHILEVFLAPPVRYPDLYVVLNVVLCTAIFGMCWLWGMKRQLEVGWSISWVDATPSRNGAVLDTRNVRAKLE
ncbi:glucosyltransferase [Cantharellus anzutake]|uniref:glucosyltransferase n=1 Tax=Cantharellus anzutake TaxID=1750568 RepID=UPI001905B7EC|nr:glucosyltransferase [Cantharellus anzutake]KAF8333559.1 glucosyltransferase [Cantharellus anzutake]